MIYLVTGVPGSGKTLYTIDQIILPFIKEGRPVFTDISGWDHAAHGTQPSPDNWQDTPENSVVVYDECQRIFPSDGIRGRPADPRLTAMETHRHTGHDLVFITQAPTFVHAHIRKLTGKHFHVYRSMGLKGATVFAWDGVCDQPNDRQERQRADSKRWTYPTKVFSLYKSATVHTHKFKMPSKIILLLIASGLAFLVFLYFANNSTLGKAVLSQTGIQTDTQTQTGNGGEKHKAGDTAGGASPEFNNPINAELSKLMPTPVAMVGCYSGRFCRCYDTSGNELDLQDTTCRDFAEGNRAIPRNIYFTAPQGSSDQPDQPAKTESSIL